MMHLRPRSVILAVLLGACSFAPDHARPALPVSAVWASPDDRVTQAAQKIRWQEFFAAPALQALIRTALDNNRDLRIAVSRVGVARSQYRIQHADLFPQLNAGADSLRAAVPQSISPTGQGITKDLYGGFLSASWEIDLWGRVRNLDTAALDTWLATDEARRAVTLSLISQVANTWLLSRELDERIALTNKTIDNRRESARIARRRYEVGAAPRIDLTQAETLVGQAESALIALEQQREQTRNALTLILGTPVDPEVAMLSSIENAVVRDLPPGLPSDLLETRPDIRGAEDRLRATEADIGAARAAFFPRISLVGDYGSASTELHDLFAANSITWIAGANAMAPLFDGGRLLGNLAGAKAERAIAIADYERTVQTAFRDVSDALAARRWLTQQMDTQRRTLTELNERAQLADLRYRTGASPYLEVLQAQRDLFDAEQALVETRRARLSSEVNLYAALGGGDDGPAASAAVTASEKGDQEKNGRTQ